MERDSVTAGKIDDQVLSGCASATALRIIEIVQNDRAPIHSLQAAIGANPVFTAHLLTLINFVPGLAQRVLSLSQAISVLGLDQIKSLALGLLAFDLNPRPAPLPQPANLGWQIDLRELWEHALGSAVISAQVALSLSETSPPSLFTAGFIHDIGRVLLFRHAPDSFAYAASLAKDKNLSLPSAEALAYGIDHPTLGAKWCERSGLAAQFGDLVRLHHEPLATLNDSDGTRRMVTIVRAAEWSCEHQGMARSVAPGAASAEAWSVLGLKESDWRERAEAVRREIEAAREMFGLSRESDPLAGETRRAPAPRRSPSAQQKSAANSGRGQLIQFPHGRELANPPEMKTASGNLVLLVVEDHGSLCDMVSLFLMRHGYHVRTANNGASALEILAREEIHVVLLDLMLPKVDGFEVLRQIHKTQESRYPYVIVVSAGASEKDRKKVFDLGANEYMPKPFHLNRLLERVQAVETFLR